MTLEILLQNLDDRLRSVMALRGFFGVIGGGGREDAEGDEAVVDERDIGVVF